MTKTKSSSDIILDLTWVIWLLTIYSLPRCVVLWAWMGIRKHLPVQKSCFPLTVSYSLWLPSYWGSNSYCPENLDKGLAFTWSATTILSFLYFSVSTGLSSPLSRRKVSSPAPLGRLPLGCTPSFPTALGASVAPVYLSSQNFPCSLLPLLQASPSMLTNYTLHLAGGSGSHSWDIPQLSCQLLD